MNSFLQKPFTEKMLLDEILSSIKSLVPGIVSNSIETEKEIVDGSTKIDLNNLYHISGGDEQFVKQMLISFADSTERGLADMNDALSSHHQERIADLAHRLLPPARHIGAVELCIWLKRIEESIHNKSETLIVGNLISEAIKEFKAVKELIVKKIAEIK